MILSVSPPWFIRLPAIINPGILSKTKTSMPEYIFIGKITSGMPLKIT
jgi:hypothetical protein